MKMYIHDNDEHETELTADQKLLVRRGFEEIWRKLEDGVPKKIEQIGFWDDHVEVQIEQTRRGGDDYDGLETRTYSLSWELLLSDQDLGAWIRAQDAAEREQAEAERRRREAEEAERLQRTAQAMRRRQYEKLKAEFEPDLVGTSSPGES